jgi:preprotein translocase subunit SecD
MNRLRWVALVLLLVVPLALLAAGAIGITAWLSLKPDPVAAVLTYEIEATDSQRGNELAESVAEALERRMPRNSRGGQAATVRVVNAEHVAIDVRSRDPQLLDTIRRRAAALGTLEFRVLADRAADGELIALAESQPEAVDVMRDDRAVARWVPIVDVPEISGSFTIDPRLVVRQRGMDPVSGSLRWEVLVKLDRFDVTGALLTEAIPSTDPHTGRPCLEFAFNADGAARLGGLTSESLPDGNIERRLGIILNGSLFSAPMIQGTVTDRGEINGNFTQEEVDDLAAVLSTGTLPARIRLVSEESIEPAAPQEP